MYKINLHKPILIILLGVVGFICAQDPDSSWTQTYELADFDSLNVRFIGGWPFGDSYAVAYDATRQLAFLGSGAGVYTLDVSNPSTPTKLSEEIHTRGFVMSLFYDSALQRLYITAEVIGLEIWDVSNPYAPVKLGHCDTPGWARCVFVSGSYAYLADYANDYRAGLRVIDISTPSNPQEVGFYETPGSAERVFILGTYAYVADGFSGLRVIDVSTPSNPQEVGFCDTPGEAYGVFVLGSYAYVADRTAGMRVIDISTPSNPYEVGHCSTPDEAWGLYVSGSYAYVADHDAGLRVIDVSTPSNPHEVGYCETPGYALNVYICSYYAYVADNYGGLRVIDISTPSNPQEVAYYATHYYPHNSYGVAVSEDYVFIGAYKTGLHVYENLLLHLETDDPYALAYNGNRHLVREPGTENLHLVYTNEEKVAYRYSSDGGNNWTASKTVGEGGFPAIDLDRQTNPCVAWTLDNSLFFSKKEQTEWVTTEYTFGVLQPSHPCMATTTPEEVDIDTVHILVRLYDNFFSTNYIKEISFPITYPQRYQVRTVDASSGANMITLDFPSVSRDFTNTLHATWQHGDTVYYGTRAQEQNWGVIQNPFDPEGRNSAHPFVETYGDSIFVVWQNELDEEVYRGARHLAWPFFSWENLSQTSTTPSLYPVNASGMVTTFVDKLSALSEYDVFWRTRPADPLHNLSNSGFIESMYPQTCLRILEEQEPPFQYTVWQEGNEAPYEIKFAKTQIIPDRGTQSSAAYFTSIPGDSIPSLYLVERDSFITNWQIPVDIGIQRVTYEFPLVPPYFYKAKIIAYHEFHGQRQMRVNIDGGIQTTVNYNAAHPETIELWIPPVLYEDSLVTVELQGINTGLTIGPIYIYRYECGSGGNISGGPQSIDMNPLSTIKYSKGNIFAGQVCFDIELPFEQETEMTLYDATGRLLRKMTVTKKAEFTENNLAAGVYFLRINNPLTGKATTMKFIKIK